MCGHVIGLIGRASLSGALNLQTYQPEMISQLIIPWTTMYISHVIISF